MGKAKKPARKRKAPARKRRRPARGKPRRCKHTGRAVAIIGVDVEAYACRKCDAAGVRPVGHSNDSTPEVQIEMHAAERLAALAVSGIGDSDVWRDDVRTETEIDSGPWQSAFNAQLWAWDISRPLAEQLAETAADDAAADALESCPVDHGHAKSVAALADGIVEVGGTLPYRFSASAVSASPDQPVCTACGRTAESTDVAHAKWWTRSDSGWRCVGCNAPASDSPDVLEYELTRDAEPDYRDEDGPEVERIMAEMENA